MAQQGLKKRLRNAQLKKYFCCGIAFLSTAVQLFSFRRKLLSEIIGWHSGIVLAEILLKFILIQRILRAERTGSTESASLLLDSFVFSVAVQFLSVFSLKFVWLYLLGGAYGLYRAYNFVRSLMPTSETEDPAVKAEREEKKRLKLEKKIKQGKVIMRQTNR